MKKSNNAATLTATTSNLPELKSALEKAIHVLNAHLNSDAEGKVSAVVEKNSVNMSAVKKALVDFNRLAASEYYKATPAVDVIRDASVPAYALTFDKENGYWYESTRVYPTLHGMRDYLPEGCLDRVDVLRRCAAYLAMTGMDNRAVVLTGYTDAEGKSHDVPTKAVAAILKPFVDDKSTISKSAVKNMLTRAMLELTDNGCEPLVTSAMLNDFATFCVKKTGEWGVRAMASQSHIGDLVLEYVHMTLTGKGKFSVKVD